jgi:hypothetical protein
MVNEHEEPRYNDIDSENLLIRPPELSGNPEIGVFSSKAGETGVGNEFTLLCISFILRRVI